MEAKKYQQFRGQPRLPKFAVPRRYDLHLKPDLDACKFSGAVQITVDVVSATKHLVLNAAELSVDSKSVQFKTPTKVLEAAVVEMCEEDEIVVIEFGESLPVGEGVLSVSFEGTLNDRMKGFYRSVYEHNGVKKNMAVTQFEPADARRCFPCWDEPACKATFKITLEVPSDLVALSNMPVIEEKVDGNLKRVSYQESPIMSTYLVAVVVGLFDYIEDQTPDGIAVRVYCKVGKADQGKFALDVAVKTLGIYKEYFAVPYSLPKLDMIAIPDFAAGAMENYGLVTYRETALLYDEKHSAAANKQRVATVVAHELAHQWFGNLVTMEWWTHLWLNEGFATWVSYLAADSLFPEWKIWTQFLDESTEGLRLDGLLESHPIEVDINHAGEIDEIFDAISYRKGASVIRMLQSYLGAECFQRALASYIKKFACSNAKTEDLWSVLQEESGEPVNKLMNSWTKQKGYPVVSAKLQDHKLEFEQSHFLLSGSPGDGQWIVPVTLCCGTYDARKSFLLQAKSETHDIKDLLGASTSKSNSWVKINLDQTGFYRVKYDEDLSVRLRYAIEKNYLSTMDRYGILDDSYALSVACHQSLASLLALMGAYKQENDYTVLSNLISISCKVVRIAADAVPELLEDMKLFFINLFQYSAERLGWDPKPGESHLDAMLRGELLTALSLFEHEETQKEASRRFHIFLDDRNTPVLPPDLRRVCIYVYIYFWLFILSSEISCARTTSLQAVYVSVMLKVTKSNRSGYDSLLRIYRESDLSQEKTRILGSLGSCKDPEIIDEILNFLLSSEVRSQDAVHGLGVSREGRETAWKWLKENWDQIVKTYGAGFLVTRFIGSVVSPFSTYEKATEVEEFFASRMKPFIARTLKQSIERVHINAKWVESIQKEKELADVVKELAYRKD
ncbi:OLC1v1029306C1 [Oldenlandia corymbosa var. corymbosa]|uniref:Aminopeptidase n=1 Tax=Oldenlandia corymbosa var. corymbosa TaxID=529605 RepID=A0AAV1CEE0_OLDCO|nr:OLC1v1029306C1 [Oldenlandia corymbosa var. corymbosa]